MAEPARIPEPDPSPTAGAARRAGLGDEAVVPPTGPRRGGLGEEPAVPPTGARRSGLGEEPVVPPSGSRPRGMGRGLAAILSSGPQQDGPAAPGLREVAVSLVRPNPTQPRTEFDEDALVALSRSIAARGVLQPVVVRPLAGGTYELIAGERRVRASRMAGLDTIPAIVRETDETDRLELALIENMAREDLNAVEEARACATLVDDLGLSKEEVGRRVGRSRVAISNMIRTLELPDEVLAMIERGELSAGHGRALLMCRDHSERLRLARRARDEGWSVRVTEDRARDAEAGGRPAREPVVIHPDLEDSIAAAEDALSAALGHEVRIRPRAGGYRVELDLEHPREGVEMAEQILRRHA
ncbi:MAG: ParB family transcriptional regulator, chromosome partitioning protein [Thermoleophilaceae bacterium]|nr:ParB family transcriptional regulator, chromosome partitioning protein [Thermoleophilaceae bacterium]